MEQMPRSVTFYNLSEMYAIKNINDDDKIILFEDKHGNFKKYDFVVNPNNYQINSFTFPNCHNSRICKGTEIKKLMQEYKEREEKNKEKEKVKEEIKTSVTDELLSKHSDRNEVTESIVNFILSNNTIHTLRQDVNLEMWIYDKNKGIYIPEAQSHIKEATNEILGKRYTTQFLNEIIRKIEARTFISAEELFKENIEEMCVLNGVLNVRTRSITGFNPDKRFFSQIPVKFDPLKDCPKIKEFISQIVEDKEDILLIQEFIGYCLYKNYPIEKIFILLGKGRNGKGQLIELIKRFLGVENTCALSLEQITKPNGFDISELHKKLVNLGGDIEGGEYGTLKNTGILKTITGNNEIQASRKFKSTLNFKNYSKLLFACNELPKTLDHSKGFFDRIMILVFPNTFYYQEDYNTLSEEDKKTARIRINDVISTITTEEELSGFLNWILEGLDRLLKNGHFTFTKSNQNIRDRYIKLSDSFASFCSEHIKEEYDGMIKKEDLRQAFNLYCKNNKLNSVTEKQINNYLTKEMGAFSTRILSNSQQISIWKNIKFSEGSEDSEGFSTYSKFYFFPIGVKKVSSLTTLTNDDENTSTSISKYATEKVTEEPLRDPRIEKAEKDFYATRSSGSRV